MKLLIGNKVHSSWSLRPWVLMTHFGIPFEEILIPFGPAFDDPAWKAKVRAYNPQEKVPALVDEDVVVWETLAIMEYLAETFPEKAIWPRDKKARALARAISSEMHAGFSALRNACPMNLGKKHPTKDRGPEVADNVRRITQIWNDCRTRFGAGGPFLFGEFSAADAMFAPVTVRFTGYSIPVDAVSARYIAAVQSTPAFQAWRTAALQEPWLVPLDEADEPVLENYRPHLKN
ncbi:MAG: glutathione S-transferase family protein [Beijerinckiaceae bacterium]